MSETQNTPSSEKLVYSVVVLLLIIIAILAYFLGQKSSPLSNSPSSVTNVENQTPLLPSLPGSHIQMTYIGCQEPECYSQENLNQLIEMNSFLGTSIQQLDVSTPEAQALIKEHNIR